MGARKPFEQDLHDKFDAPAKEAVAKFMKERYDTNVIPNPDKYGVDLLVMRGDKRIGQIEVEVRQWNPCPYPTIHVPQRKTKFFNGTTLFFALTRDMKHAYWIETTEIDKYPLKEISNYKVQSGELFFDVPTNEFVFVNLE